MARFHEIVEGVVDRPEIRVDLLAHVAGQEAEPLARLDGRPRQDESVGLAAFEKRYRVPDGEPGLAGAGRALGEDELVLPKGLEIGVLDGVAGANRAALARRDLLEAGTPRRRLGGREERPLHGALLDGAVDVAERQGGAVADAFVQVLEHVPRLVGGARHALQHDVVAERVGGDAEAALEMGEVLVVMAENEARQAVVVEGEGDLGPLLDARRTVGLAVHRSRNPFVCPQPSLLTPRPMPGTRRPRSPRSRRTSCSWPRP